MIVRWPTERCCNNILCACAAFLVFACDSGGDTNLWKRDFSKRAEGNSARGAGELTGYWEGQVAMGSIRAKIENAKITLAMKCDRDGKVVAQGSAPMSVQKSDPAKMILETDLKSSGDETCGFRFNKGSEFVYAFGEPGLLNVNFSGTSMAALRRLSSLEPGT